MASGRPRDVQKELYWRRAVRAQAASGLAARAWCVRQGMEVRAFCRWRIELARRDAEKASMSFVPVRVTDDALEPAHPIEIVLSGGRVVRVRGQVDRRVLADVLAVLTSASSVEPEGQAC